MCKTKLPLNASANNYSVYVNASYIFAIELHCCLKIQKTSANHTFALDDMLLNTLVVYFDSKLHIVIVLLKKILENSLQTNVNFLFE